MIKIRKSAEIYQANGQIENGTFQGKWHFSFGEYFDHEYMQFGTLRVFNDDTLSPGAIWPLHPHRDIEVVTYCAAGEFRHEDQNGKGGILKKGWVQHTTVGKGMLHSEINNKSDEPMRFIQLWFIPEQYGLEPSVEQRKVEKPERTNKLLLLVSRQDKKALKILSDANVYSCFLEKNKSISHKFKKGYGGYLYVVEGGPVLINKNKLDNLDAAILENEENVSILAEGTTELLLVIVRVD